MALFAPTPDAAASQLMQRSQAESPQPGLVLAGAWGWVGCEDALGAHARLVERLRGFAFPQVYVYPAHALHVTLATMSSFKKPGDILGVVGPEGGAEVVRVWSSVVESALRQCSLRLGDGSVELVAERLELSNAAGFITYSDPRGTIATIRDAIRQTVRSHPDALALDSKHQGALLRSLAIPNIVHSTLVRFADSMSTSEAAAFAERFASLASDWKPVRVRFSSLSFAFERVPYMHGVRSEQEVRVFSLQQGAQ